MAVIIILRAATGQWRAECGSPSHEWAFEGSWTEMGSYLLTHVQDDHGRDGDIEPYAPVDDFAQRGRDILAAMRVEGTDEGGG